MQKQKRKAIRKLFALHANGKIFLALRPRPLWPFREIVLQVISADCYGPFLHHCSKNNGAEASQDNNNNNNKKAAANQKYFES